MATRKSNEDMLREMILKRSEFDPKMEKAKNKVKETMSELGLEIPPDAQLYPEPKFEDVKNILLNKDGPDIRCFDHYFRPIPLVNMFISLHKLHIHKNTY